MLQFIFNDSEAYLQNQRQEQGVIVGTVKLRNEDKEVQLIYTGKTNQQIQKKQTDQQKQNQNKQEKGKQNEKLYSLLKSNLQKQVRRGDPNARVTANMMMDLNEFELYRRLVIIAAEDVELSKETSVISWLMMATSKGFITTPFHKEFVLNYVSSLISHKVCRRLSFEKQDKDLSLQEILNSSHEEKKYIAGTYLRNFYGGLDGDGPMLVSICTSYIITNSPLPNFSLSLMNNQIQMKIQNLKLVFNDAAVDFHIYPELITLIYKDLQSKSNTENIEEKEMKDLIKRCIWECSSRINYRCKEDSSLFPLWNKIQRSFMYHTKVYLSKVF